MPLIVVAGLPSSGKSSVAAALAEACRALGQDVQVVDEDSLHLKRNESYKGAVLLLPPPARPPPLPVQSGGVCSSCLLSACCCPFRL